LEYVSGTTPLNDEWEVTGLAVLCNPVTSSCGFESHKKLQYTWWFETEVAPWAALEKISNSGTKLGGGVNEKGWKASLAWSPNNTVAAIRPPHILLSSSMVQDMARDGWIHS
jgi:hypothetical protein